MQAYQDKFQIGAIHQKVATTYKSHRRVFDSKLNSFFQAANLALTELEKLWKARTEKRQENATRRAGEAAKEKKEKAAQERRIAQQEKEDPGSVQKKAQADAAEAARAQLYMSEGRGGVFFQNVKS